MIVFVPYVYYTNSIVELKLEKNQCSGSCDMNMRSCYYWNDNDNKCYKGRCQKELGWKDPECIIDESINHVQQCQKSCIVTAVIFLVLFIVFYYI